MPSSIVEIILLAAILSIDSFSAALALGFRPFSFRQATSFALASGASEGLVTCLGFFLGQRLTDRMAAYDHWIAFALLAAVGLKMVFEGVKGPKSEDASERFHGPLKILLVSLATSLDSLGVGVAWGLRSSEGANSLATFAGIIGITAVLATFAGLYLARALSKSFGARCEIAGGLVLLGMAFWIAMF